MELQNFTKWIVFQGLKLPQEDPVGKYARMINKDVEWPTDGFDSLEEVIKFHEKHHKNGSEEAWKSLQYTAKLAWQDYQKSLLT